MRRYGRDRRSKSFCRRSLLPRFDGLKPAAALLHESAPSARAGPILLAVHDEIVVERGEGQVQEVEAWLEKAMVDGIDGVLNAPDVEGPRVPVEVEVKSGKTWAG